MEADIQHDHVILPNCSRLSWCELSIKQDKRLKVDIQIIFRERHNNASAGTDSGNKMAADVDQKFWHDGGDVFFNSILLNKNLRFKK